PAQAQLRWAVKAAVHASFSRVLWLVTQISSRELEEYVFQARAPLQVGKILSFRKRAQQRLGVHAIAEHRVAGPLDAAAERSRLAQPRLEPRPVHLDHVGLDVLGDQGARRALGNDAAVIHDGQAMTQAL